MEIVSLNFDNLDPSSLELASVRKHNDLIDAKYQVQSIQEQRIILMLLAQIKPNDEDFKGYRITVADFAEKIGLKVGGVYTEMEQTLKTLMSRVITIKNGKSFLILNWLSSAKYMHGSGYVELAFDPNLKPYLLQLQDHYTIYQLANVLFFKCTYSGRLYELLKKEAFKKDKNGNFSVLFQYEELREIFGVGKKEYANFKDFRVKTIEPARSEISDKTELNILDVKYGKMGRKVTNMTFVVAVRSENETDLRQANLRLEDINPEPAENENHPIIDSLVSLGFSLETAKRYKNKHGVKAIERNIAYTLAKKQTGKVDDLPAYLSRAIAEDWGSAWEVEHKKAEEKKQKVIQAKKDKELEEKRLEKEKKEMYQKAFDNFLKLSNYEQEELKNEFKKQTNATTLESMKNAETNEKDFYSSQLVLSSFKVFLVGNNI